MKSIHLNLLGISFFVFTACSQGTLDQRTTSANGINHKVDEQENSGDLKPDHSRASTCALTLVDEQNTYQDQILNFRITSDDSQYQSFCNLIDTEHASLGIFYLVGGSTLEDMRESLGPWYQQIQKQTQIFQGVVFTKGLNTKNRPKFTQSLGFELQLFRPMVDQSLLEVFPSLHSEKPVALIVDGKGRAVLLPMQGLKLPRLIALLKNVFKNSKLADKLDKNFSKPTPNPFYWDGLNDEVPSDWQLQDVGSVRVTN